MQMLEQTSKRGDQGAARASRPRWGTVKKANAEYSIGKTEIYETAKKHPKLLRKWGNKTLVDFDVLDEIMDKLPVAELRPIAHIHGDPKVLAKRERSKKRFRERRRSKKQRTTGKAA
jgi:hypothetical protein